MIQETYNLEQEGKEYTGERKQREFQGAHLIEAGSVNERMVCDLIETGLGLAHTTLLLNEELKADNKEEVGISCVREAYLRLEPETILIRKVAMGTNDAHSPWALASFNLFKQLAVSFGVLDPRVTPDPPMPPPLQTNENAIVALEDSVDLEDSVALVIAPTHPHHPPQEPEAVKTRKTPRPPQRDTNHELIPTGLHTKPPLPLCTHASPSRTCTILIDLRNTVYTR